MVAELNFGGDCSAQGHCGLQDGEPGCCQGERVWEHGTRSRAGPSLHHLSSVWPWRSCRGGWCQGSSLLSCGGLPLPHGTLAGAGWKDAALNLPAQHPERVGSQSR